jgi:hypothetical protein
MTDNWRESIIKGYKYDFIAYYLANKALVSQITYDSTTSFFFF